MWLSAGHGHSSLDCPTPAVTTACGIACDTRSSALTYHVAHTTNAHTDIRTESQVRTDSQVVRVDAAVNSGNTLASWAELTEPATSIQLLSSANEAYRIALQQEEDAAVSFVGANAPTTYCSTLLGSVNPLASQCGTRFMSRQF